MQNRIFRIIYASILIIQSLFIWQLCSRWEGVLWVWLFANPLQYFEIAARYAATIRETRFPPTSPKAPTSITTTITMFTINNIISHLSQSQLKKNPIRLQSPDLTSSCMLNHRSTHHTDMACTSPSLQSSNDNSVIITILWSSSYYYYMFFTTKRKTFTHTYTHHKTYISCVLMSSPRGQIFHW